MFTIMMLQESGPTSKPSDAEPLKPGMVPNSPTNRGAVKTRARSPAHGIVLSGVNWCVNSQIGSESLCHHVLYAALCGVQDTSYWRAVPAFHRVLSADCMSAGCGLA